MKILYCDDTGIGSISADNISQPISLSVSVQNYRTCGKRPQNVHERGLKLLVNITEDQLLWTCWKCAPKGAISVRVDIWDPVIENSDGQSGEFKLCL